MKTKNTIQGRWRYVKDVGVCSVCAWPHVQPSTGVYKEPNGTVYELNIGGQESRLCRVCLENLIREVRRAEVGELVENLAILCDWVHICHDSDGGIRVSAKFGPHVFSCSATFLGQAVQQVFSQVNS